MRLITAADYLAFHMDCQRGDEELSWDIKEWHSEAMGLLKQRALVVAEADAGLKTLPRAHLRKLDPRPADRIVAYKRHGEDVTVAEHYRRIGEKLERRILPSLVVGKENEVSRNPSPLTVNACIQKHCEFYPLERVFLHECSRPCMCPRRRRWFCLVSDVIVEEWGKYHGWHDKR